MQNKSKNTHIFYILLKKVLTDKNYYSNRGIADGVVAELVDAPDSKSGFFGSESSILSGPTIERTLQNVLFFLLFKQKPSECA